MKDLRALREDQDFYLGEILLALSFYISEDPAPQFADENVLLSARPRQIIRFFARAAQLYWCNG